MPNRHQKFTVLIERDQEGYYVAPVPALRDCHTQAKNLDTRMKRIIRVLERIGFRVVRTGGSHVS